MITMQLTGTDIQDAKTVIDVAVDRGWIVHPEYKLTAAQVGKLYDALYRAQAKVGTTYEMVPARRGRRPLWGLRAATRKQLDRGQTS